MFNASVNIVEMAIFFLLFAIKSLFQKGKFQ